MSQNLKKSAVWEVFEKVEESEDGKKKVQCKLCKTKLVYLGGTSSMKNHIEAKHPSHSTNTKSSGCLKIVGAVPGALRSNDVRSYFSPVNTKCSKVRYTHLNQKLAEMCAIDFRPISIVNGEGFKAFINAIDPTYTVPSHTTIRNYVRKTYLDSKYIMMKVISEQESVALTTDLWTSHATQGYITVTSHFINNDWQLHSQVLATRHVCDRHTGENICNEMQNIVDEYHVQKVECVTRDNAANMDVAMRMFGTPNLGCAGHTVQLSIHDGLKISELTKSIARFRNLVSHFHRSVLCTEALEKEQKSKFPDKKPLSLIQDVSTRWNSTYFMLQRMVSLRISVYGVLHNRNIVKEKDAQMLELSDNDWSVAEHLCALLKPLQIATQTMSGEYYPTLGNVYPIINSIVAFHLKEKELKVEEVMPASVKRCRKLIRESLQRRFKLGQEETFVLAATALNPSHKKLAMISSEKRDEVKSYLKNEVSQLMKKVQEGEDENMSSASAKKMKLENENDAMKFLLGDYYEMEEMDDNSEDSEIDSYFSEKRTALSALDWWKVNCHRYPFLSKVARRLLAIPATSTPSERVFSAAGNTVVPNRASLDPGTVDELVFLHSALSKKGQAKLRNIDPQVPDENPEKQRFVA